ncbi:MAG: class I SAM-dependent methyltransferase [Phycisphaerales bacterium]|nr:class I SAM-dependent methyltransferase [Phycisphaerales bacterium]MCB9857284.1 class I SAM-dependent methyltransferase [Phycisphaerales bacterium]MCB9863002.1 class I SAM-dependent methyltransferase [Phycisphaerales bacterium]
MPESATNTTPPTNDDSTSPGAFPRMIERPCPLCGAVEFSRHLDASDTTFGFPGTFRVVRCDACGMMFTNPQVASEHIGRYFPTDYSAHDAGRARRHATSTKRGHDPWDTLAPFGKGQLLDVGCGSGAFMLRQRERGWHVFGIEPSDAAAAVARSLGLSEVWTSDVANAPLNGHSFDAITLMGVLDHIPEPLAALSKLRSACNKGGQLIATVPNAAGAAAKLFGPSWPGWDLPRHQNHFSVESLRRMLLKAGFDRVDVLWKRRTSHWRRGAELHAAATSSAYWRTVAASRNLCGLLARIHARGPRADEIIAVARCE